MKYIKRIIVVYAGIIIVLALVFTGYKHFQRNNGMHEISGYKIKRVKEGNFFVEYHQTKKYSSGTNLVEAVVLHHTTGTSAKESLGSLCYSKREASCHVIIDYDGTRYVLAAPEKITWHAGYSYLNGKNQVNRFSIGIEFQGNTCKKPLTDEQINSAIEYLIPIIKKYRIPLNNIVTHEQVRHDWIIQNPQKVKELAAKKKPVREKADITEVEYKRFMAKLNNKYKLSN